MKRFSILLVALLAMTANAQVSTNTVVESTTTLEGPSESDQTTSVQESEAKDIIPPAADMLSSTSPITPTSIFPEKKPYDQAREELIRAMELYNKGHFEAASDTALEAYDDLTEMRRIPGVKRSVVRGQAKQAAEVYVDAGIAYIKNYVRRAGGSPEVQEEGRARLEDLRDVAKNYTELNKRLNNAINSLISTPVGQSK